MHNPRQTAFFTHTHTHTETDKGHTKNERADGESTMEKGGGG